MVTTCHIIFPGTEDSSQKLAWGRTWKADVIFQAEILKIKLGHVHFLTKLYKSLTDTSQILSFAPDRGSDARRRKPKGEYSGEAHIGKSAPHSHRRCRR